MKFACPQRTQIFRSIILPKNNVLRYHWFEITQPHLCVPHHLCHQNVEFEKLQQIVLQIEIFIQHDWVKSSRALMRLIRNFTCLKKYHSWWLRGSARKDGRQACYISNGRFAIGPRCVIMKNEILWVDCSHMAAPSNSKHVFTMSRNCWFFVYKGAEHFCEKTPSTTQGA